MKIVVIGTNGQVGWELARSLLPLGDVIALDRSKADLAHPESLAQLISDIKPDVIVNAAAYTAVDKAEEEEELATTINGVAPGVLAETAKQLNALLIHYSTDYVFDGTKDGEYTEDDTPNPINVYGRSKLDGEKAIEKVGCDYLILRTTWVYAARGKNFLKTMLRLFMEREELRVIDDQYGAPTWARNIADATAHLIVAAQNERKANSFRSMVSNLSASGKTTWHGFAAAIHESVSEVFPDLKVETQRILPIKTIEYPTPALRPSNSCLSAGVVARKYGVTMPFWDEAMKLCLQELQDK